ncbi:tRNA dimethylallyltransferase [Gemmobacter tilapiae]|uniref:tRNA dimethylallyltransferase n=2 Tax=Neogemmobacter tilapiae TaxID=875041 RepID=A0A918TSS2_9RHOB|nr:tRNA dimethylallyltransferase [Gemmobacter tilapiae]
MDMARDGGIIVNADALQVYDCWQILSARPTDAEMASHPHALYGHVARGQPYSVGHWLRQVTDLLASGERLIIVGGTGLYLSALTEGLADIPPIPPEVRAEADTLDAATMLTALDAETASRIDQQNPARIKRAWEVWRATGRPLSSWQDETPPPVLPLSATARAVVLTSDRDWLAARIDSRFLAMLQGGALDEARANLPFWEAAAPWAQAIGAPELVAHLRGEMTLEEATSCAQAASRQYAKRQRTWFRSRMKAWERLHLT